MTRVFTVTLSNASGAALGSNSTATVTITDNDPPAAVSDGDGNGSGGGGSADRLFLVGLTTDWLCPEPHDDDAGRGALGDVNPSRQY